MVVVEATLTLVENKDARVRLLLLLLLLVTLLRWMLLSLLLLKPRRWRERSEDDHLAAEECSLIIGMQIVTWTLDSVEPVY